MTGLRRSSAHTTGLTPGSAVTRSESPFRNYNLLNLLVSRLPPHSEKKRGTQHEATWNFLAIAFAGVAAYVAAFSTTVRYQLTLEAEVDGKPKTGSGVIEVTYSKNNDPVSQAEFSINVRGEAVALDLGSRGTLFALLKGGTDSRSGPDYIVLRAFDFPGGRSLDRL